MTAKQTPLGLSVPRRPSLRDTTLAAKVVKSGLTQAVHVSLFPVSKKQKGEGPGSGTSAAFLIVCLLKQLKLSPELPNTMLDP